MIMKRTAIILISIVLLSALPSCNKFLDTLPDNEYRSALVELSEFAVARTH